MPEPFRVLLVSGSLRTIGDGEVGSIYQKPVAWINASPRGAANAHESLRKVLGYASATIVEAACVEVPITGAMVDGAGLIADPMARERIGLVFTALVKHHDSTAAAAGR
jgi:chromate reductase